MTESAEDKWQDLVDRAWQALSRLNFSSAESDFATAIDLARNSRLGNHALAESLEGQAIAHSHIVQSLDSESRSSLTEAEALRRELLAECEQAENTTAVQIAAHLDALARNLYLQGKISEAANGYQRSLDLRRSTHGEIHIEVAQTLHNIAFLYILRANDRVTATTYLEQSQPILEKLNANPVTRTVQSQSLFQVTLEQLGICAFEQGENETARTFFQRVVEITNQEYGSSGIAPIYGQVLVRFKKIEEAKRIVNLAMKTPQQSAAWIAVCEETLAIVHD